MADLDEVSYDHGSVSSKGPTSLRVSKSALANGIDKTLKTMSMKMPRAFRLAQEKNSGLHSLLLKMAVVTIDLRQWSKMCCLVKSVRVAIVLEGRF